MRNDDAALGRTHDDPVASARCMALALRCWPRCSPVLGADRLPGRRARPRACEPPSTPSTATPSTTSARRWPPRRRQLEAIEAAGEAPTDAPPGTSLPEILQRLTLARTLASTYEKQLNSLEKAEAARQRQDEQQRASEAWRGFEQPPPYSILVVDELRDELRGRAQRARQREGDQRACSIGSRRDYAARLKAAQGAARLAAEAADRARGTPAFQQREWEHGMAALRASVDSAVQGLLQIGRRGAQAEVDAANATAELATRKLNAVGTSVDLPRADLDRMLAEIEARRRSRRRRISSARSKASAAASEAVSRGGCAARSRPAPPARRPRRDGVSAELERDLAAAREAAATASQRVFLLREYLLQLDGEKAAWEARAIAINLTRSGARAGGVRPADGVAGRSARDQAVPGAAARDRREPAARRGSAAARGDARRDAGFAPADRYAAAATAATCARRSTTPCRWSAWWRNFRADFEDRRGGVAQRAPEGSVGRRPAWPRATLWNFELFAIDDSFETAEGRKLAVSRSVTVGKTFGAALIVLVGYWLSRFVVRRIERKAVAAGRATPQGAALVRKWILFVVAAILGLVALVSASIPLTAFAFLGGALAIAAGFGLQTLLKNLVSGVMLLIERPLRLGDLVEVDGIRGRVTEIGIRASTIRSADGIESMIPNSRFLEGNMTNWTYSSPQARQTIAIGVAYGSPLRKVAELLADVLERHGLVLKDPAPQVYLEEYADNAINFSMTYWVEMTEMGDTRRVKSDLLLMIDAAFTEAGISIPFPQRDVHLSTTGPVPVEIVGASGTHSAT